MLTPLVTHSSYSLLWGVPTPQQLAERVLAWGAKALALTDRNGVYGLPVFLGACHEVGVRPIVGVEIAGGWGRVVAIVRTPQGFSRVTRLLSARAALLNEACIAADVDAMLLSELENMARMDDPGLFLLSDSTYFLRTVRPSSWLFALLSSAREERWRELLKQGHRAVLSPEISFLELRQRTVQRLLIAIDKNCTIREIPDSALEPESASPAFFSIERWKGELADAIAMNEHIVEEALSEPFGNVVFPQRKGDQPSAAVLRRLASEGAQRRYGNITPEVRTRLDYELTIIEQKGFCDYFLVVYDIIQKAKKICGRGSAAASIVSYTLGITDVDPLAHNLYFDRFLNPGRKDPPDIDVDFAWDERDDILAQTVAMFGESHCARVSNHNCFRFRGALRDTARAFGMPDEETSAIENEIEYDRQGYLNRADSVWRQIFDLAKAIQGLPRNLGTHSGGIIIVPGDIVDYVPVERTGSGILVTAWDKDGVEDAGLVKIDLLGNRSLAVVRDALFNLEENDIIFDQCTWRPENDAETVAMIAKGDTMGVFYVESPAMRLLQKKTGRGDFAHLVIHSSIIRPAANRYIEEYIERLKGKPWQPLHPVLGQLFAETYGIMCYQEDVSKAATALAGFSSSDADAIRKVLTKKDRGHRLAMWRQRFFEGAAARGVSLSVIEAVWDMIMSFSGYSFVKAHSASYAMLSFQSAWLRAHYPAEFMAGVLSNHGGFYSTLAYASEARRMGLTLLPPDVNESAIRCKGRGPIIRWGLGMIAGLSTGTLHALITAREGGNTKNCADARAEQPFRPFVSLQDFAARVPFTREEAEVLVGSGSLDTIAHNLSRPRILMEMLRAVKDRSQKNAGDLFAAEPSSLTLNSTYRFRGNATLSPRRNAIAQMRWLGTTLSCHPLSLIPGALEMPRVKASKLSAHVGVLVRLIGWLITAKEVLTARDEPMEFLTFEDETAIFETVLFPVAYTKFRPLLLEGGAFVVEGTVEESHHAITLTIVRLRRLPAISRLNETRHVLSPSGFNAWRRD